MGIQIVSAVPHGAVRYTGPFRLQIKRIRLTFSALRTEKINQVFLSQIFSTTKLNMSLSLKMFLKPVWEGKMHGVRKSGIFCALFCVNMLGKSTNYSTETRP